MEKCKNLEIRNKEITAQSQMVSKKSAQIDIYLLADFKKKKKRKCVIK